MKVLFVELGMGVDLHGQDLTVAAVRACRNAIERNSLPGWRMLCPNGDRSYMRVRVTLGVPDVPGALPLDVEQVKAVFPYGTVEVRVLPGGLIADSGVLLADKGDRTQEIIMVCAAVEAGVDEAQTV
ncbi:MAG TPA: Lin0512 family protein [Symbiobacteriaceae bacterium]|nr:Lin0512 family protein [Symbiobacteriaceae bacterium]